MTDNPTSIQRRLAIWSGLIVASLLLIIVLEWAGLPAALLLGPMISAICFSFFGNKISVPRVPFNLAQGVVGCLIARTMTLPIVKEIGTEWPIFVAGVLSVVFAAILLGWILAKLQVLPGTTAIWGSFPGAATVMTLMSASFGADMRLVAFMQYTRVVIVTIVAATVATIWAASSGAPAVASVSWLAQPDWQALGATLAMVVIGVVIGRVSKIPAGPMIVPVILGSALNIAGLITIELPQLLLALSYALVGWGIGSRFDRDVIRHAGKALPRVLLSIICLVLVCAGFASLLVVFAGVDPLTAYLATSPGGADAVAIISASTHVDVAFVMSMQIARFFFVMALGPMLARFVASRSGM
ncbi:AbrB family transcriptional regulator [Martelella alba]|uniref:AbrB family transcriptional regulator n=1 Tax=Martelella alba TaxID=2590451 RepID=A0A506UIL5_9HYPH|nr:AbrB family transcriptional regulator [Martelella alba]TPW33142.1 AbrB family transcriptional regulator [Martelella alba]